MASHFMASVDHVVIDGSTVADDFRMPVGQHWNRRIWVQIGEWSRKILFFHRVDLHVIDLSTRSRYLTYGQECPSILVELVAPDL